LPAGLIRGFDTASLELWFYRKALGFLVRLDLNFAAF